MENETYNLDVFCKNCNFEGNVPIAKGIALPEVECPNCRNKMLIKKLPTVRFTPHIEDYR